MPTYSQLRAGSINDAFAIKLTLCAYVFDPRDDNQDTDFDVDDYFVTRVNIYLRDLIHCLSEQRNGYIPVFSNICERVQQTCPTIIELPSRLTDNSNIGPSIHIRCRLNYTDANFPDINDDTVVLTRFIAPATPNFRVFLIGMPLFNDRLDDSISLHETAVDLSLATRNIVRRRNGTDINIVENIYDVSPPLRLNHSNFNTNWNQVPSFLGTTMSSASFFATEMIRVVTSLMNTDLTYTSATPSPDEAPASNTQVIATLPSLPSFEANTSTQTDIGHPVLPSEDHSVSYKIFAYLFDANAAFTHVPQRFNAFISLVRDVTNSRLQSSARTPGTMNFTNMADVTDYNYEYNLRHTPPSTETIRLRDYLEWLCSIHEPYMIAKFVDHEVHSCYFPGPCLFNELIVEPTPDATTNVNTWLTNLSVKYITEHRLASNMIVHTANFIQELPSLSAVRRFTSLLMNSLDPPRSDPNTSATGLFD